MRFTLLLIFMFGNVFLMAQEKEPFVNDRDKELKTLEEKLRDLDAQINYLKQEIDKGGEEKDTHEKLTMLTEQRADIERRIEELRGVKPHPSMERERENQIYKTPKKQHEEIEKIEALIGEKKNEIRKLEKKIGGSKGEEKDYYEFYRYKLLEELEGLQREASRLRNKGPIEKGRKGSRQGKQAPVERFMMNPEFKEILEEVKKEFSQEYEELMNLRDKNPGEFFKIAKQRIGEYKKLLEIKKENPEMYENVLKQRDLERKAKELAKKILSAEGQEKDKLTADLRTLLGEIFDLRELHRDQEIKDLEKELNRLKDMKQKRQGNKNTIIDRRLKQLIGEGEEWDW